MENAPLISALDATLDAMPEPSPVAATLSPPAEPVNTPSEPPKKKRGRPPKTAAAPQHQAEPAKSAPPLNGVPSSQPMLPLPQVDPYAAERKACALALVGLVEQSGALIDPESARMEQMEKEAIASSAEKYLASKNIRDLPPGVLLLASLGMYYSRLIKTETGKSRAARFIGWLGSKLKWKRTNAYSHNRSDGERKNGVSEKAG